MARCRRFQAERNRGVNKYVPRRADDQTYVHFRTLEAKRPGDCGMNYVNLS